MAKTNVDSYDSLPTEKRLTLHNVIIQIKSVLNKDKDHCFYKIFLEKCSYQLAKKLITIFFHSITTLRFGKIKTTKEKFFAEKKPIKIWDVNVENLVISKLIETKTNSKYLIGMKLDKVIRPLLLIIPKMSGYVKTFKVKERDKDKSNKLMSFRIEDEKLLEKYKAIWTKIEDLKNIELNTLPVYDGRHIIKNKDIS